MKTKILLTAIALMTITSLAMASGSTKTSDDRGNGPGYQQVIVNNFYFDNGYEYASRINRFHNSFITFDFYSPLFTETYWYHFTPFTWGVSIYDDWYYYGAGVSRYNWRSGFGGSYWWGYDPWWDYDPWMGYGWNSWYAPGSGYSVNYYLGRPYYHYPNSWSRWDQPHWYGSGPGKGFDNSHHGPSHGENNYNNHTDYNNNTNYNPSHPYDQARRSASSVSRGRNPLPQSPSPQYNSGRAQTGNDKEKSNNGLRMGQVRREVAVPSEAKPNQPVRTNNPNVNDRTSPRRQSHKDAVGPPSETPVRQQTQSTVKTTRQKTTEKSSGELDKTTSPKSETRRKTPSSENK